MAENNGFCSYNCANTQLNKEQCIDPDVILPSGLKARSTEVCDGNCNVGWPLPCEDEAICNGYTYGIYCQHRFKNRLAYVAPRDICDGGKDCRNGEDEKNCTVTETTEISCTHISTKKLVPVYNYTRCTTVDKTNINGLTDDRLYCSSTDLVKYQANCTDPSRVGVTCEVGGYNSTVSKFLICLDDSITACDDKIESKCLITNSCRVHKHFMCDGKTDCVDMADEFDASCKSTTTETCRRRIGMEVELRIPISWLKDGVMDCKNGVDETSDWPTCGVGKRSRYVASEETKCKNVFICRTGEPGYVEMEDLCDGLETCGNENEICLVSILSESLSTSVLTTDKGRTKMLSYCLPGLSNLEFLANKCVTEQYKFPDEDIFGYTKTAVILPHRKQLCDNMYGEQYIYTSCTGRCINTSCPLKNIPRYEVCPNQFPRRIGTLVNNEYLIFVTKQGGDFYTNRYFVCDNKVQCLDYTKICDLVYDCEDGSDETYCTNNFKCNSSRELLPKTKKCDGQIDCFDFSDECNEQCSKEILGGNMLKGLSWLIGLVAVLANMVLITKSLGTIKRCRTSVALINRFLILIIALGDFFVGCYLFIIASYDAFIFKKSYCPKESFWITSFECSMIGVISTIGSQISLFSMACLGIVRIHGIWNSMRIPGEITLIKFLKIVSVVLFVVLVSLAIAVSPIIESFEDFFVNGVKFSDELKIFIGTPNKATVFKAIQAYYGRTKDTTLDWKILIQMVKDMFSHDQDYDDPTLKVDKVHFYGNDGVCLFKYFVHKDDPQRLFVWSILAVNFICFAFISLSYFMIGILSRKSSNSILSSQNNLQIAKRNKRMNQRIAIIITTDFLCWVPFIVICVLHSLEVTDATEWYGIFSMVILPINSVINPFLYDEALTKVFKSLSSRILFTRVCNLGAIQSVREMIHLAANKATRKASERSNTTQNQVMELEDLQFRATNNALSI
ncbi:hypothetical protein ACHWQZ_G019168 [Mnemiopsis leidyi]